MAGETKTTLRLQAVCASRKRRLLLISTAESTVDSLQQLVVTTYRRLYPSDRPFLADRLQDGDGCDIPPDYLVGDVFSDRAIVTVVEAGVETPSEDAQPESAMVTDVLPVNGKVAKKRKVDEIVVIDADVDLVKEVVNPPTKKPRKEREKSAAVAAAVAVEPVSVAANKSVAVQSRKQSLVVDAQEKVPILGKRKKGTSDTSSSDCSSDSELRRKVRRESLASVGSTGEAHASGAEVQSPGVLTRAQVERSIREIVDAMPEDRVGKLTQRFVWKQLQMKHARRVEPHREYAYERSLPLIAERAIQSSRPKGASRDVNGADRAADAVNRSAVAADLLAVQQADAEEERAPALRLAAAAAAVKTEKVVTAASSDDSSSSDDDEDADENASSDSDDSSSSSSSDESDGEAGSVERKVKTVEDEERIASEVAHAATAADSDESGSTSESSSSESSSESGSESEGSEEGEGEGSVSAVAVVKLAASDKKIAKEVSSSESEDGESNDSDSSSSEEEANGKEEVKKNKEAVRPTVKVDGGKNSAAKAPAKSASAPKAAAVAIAIPASSSSENSDDSSDSDSNSDSDKDKSEKSAASVKSSASGLSADLRVHSLSTLARVMSASARVSSDSSSSESEDEVEPTKTTNGAAAMTPAGRVGAKSANGTRKENGKTSATKVESGSDGDSESSDSDSSEATKKRKISGKSVLADLALDATPGSVAAPVVEKVLSESAVKRQKEVDRRRSKTALKVAAAIAPPSTLNTLTNFGTPSLGMPMSLHSQRVSLTPLESRLSMLATPTPSLPNSPLVRAGFTNGSAVNSVLNTPLLSNVGERALKRQQSLQRKALQHQQKLPDGGRKSLLTQEDMTLLSDGTKGVEKLLRDSARWSDDDV